MRLARPHISSSITGLWSVFDQESLLLDLCELAAAPVMTSWQQMACTFGPSQVAVYPHITPQGSVFFFPGDRVLGASVSEVVLRLQEPSRIADLLAAKFPATHVCIVAPSRYEGSFASFDHFLNRTTASGEPLGYHAGSFKATQQLSSLRKGLGWDSRLPCHVVGFSKGGTVLNQILSEVAALAQLGKGMPPAPEASAELAAALHQVHFVDAGLNCRGAYLTDLQVFEALGAWAAQHPNFTIALHGTPRQWDDARRPWIPLEKNRFLAGCLAAGVAIKETRYFAGQRPSLEMHFRSLEAFQT